MKCFFFCLKKLLACSSDQGIQSSKQLTLYLRVKFVNVLEKSGFNDALKLPKTQSIYIIKNIMGKVSKMKINKYFNQTYL